MSKATRSAVAKDGGAINGLPDNCHSMTEGRGTAKPIDLDSLVSKIGCLDPEALEVWARKNIIREIASLVRKARLDAGLSQKQLAERSNIDQAVLSRLENAPFERSDGNIDGPGIARIESLLLKCGYHLRVEIVPVNVKDRSDESLQCNN